MAGIRLVTVIAGAAWRRVNAAALVFLLLISPAVAELQQPSPDLSPQRVVEIQLQSLQRNDSPTPDAGIEQTWAFAHPDNKQLTGPLERFALMIKGPNYNLLLKLREYRIEKVVRTENRALFNVSIVTAAGQRASFQWEVAKVDAGIHAGAWMTIGVSPPLRSGDAI